MRLFLILAACIPFVFAADSRKPGRLEQHPIGISLGADYISAAIATDKHETRFLLQVEGDEDYKSYMRQDLWDRPYRRPRAMESAEINNQLTSVLQATHGKPPSVKKIQPTIEKLKKKLAKAFGQSSLLNIVIGVPLFLSVQSRNKIHAEMHDAGFRVLSTIRQPALASTLFSFGNEEMPTGLFTSLVVDYNRASLDLSVTPTSYGASDVLAQQSYPNFGEDALDLKIASLVLNETVEGRQWAPLGQLAQQIRLQRRRGVDSKTKSREIHLRKSKRLASEGSTRDQEMWNELDLSGFGDAATRMDLSRLTRATDVEREHFVGILNAIDDFVNQHSYNADYTMSSAWNPRLSEKSNMLLSGDADESGFQDLRAVLDHSDVDWPLDSEKDSPTPWQVSARGAAIHAKKRVVAAELEKKVEAYTEQGLQEQEIKQQIRLMVPHDL